MLIAALELKRHEQPPAVQSPTVIDEETLQLLRATWSTRTAVLVSDMSKESQNVLARGSRSYDQLPCQRQMTAQCVPLEDPAGAPIYYRSAHAVEDSVDASTHVSKTDI